jgi:hypothetical protein
MDKRINGIEMGYKFDEDLGYCNFLLDTLKVKDPKFSSFISICVHLFSAGTAKFVRSAIQLHV